MAHADGTLSGWGGGSESHLAFVLWTLFIVRRSGL